MGYKSTTAQLFTVPPNIAAFVLVLLTSTLSDKIKARGPIMVVCCILAMGGYIMLLASEENGVRYGGTFLVATGIYPGSPMIMVCLITNKKVFYFIKAGLTNVVLSFRRAGCQTIWHLIMFGQQALDFKLPLLTVLHLLLLSFIYQETRKILLLTLFLPHIIVFTPCFSRLFTKYVARPDYTLGHSMSLGSLVLCVITVALQIIYCRWENKQREKGSRDHRLAESSEHWLGHRHPAFRYTI